MIPTNHTALLAFAALGFMGCHNNKEADSADDMQGGSADHNEDHRDHEQSQDAEETLQEAEEEIDEAADEVKDEVDGDPTTE